MRKLIITQVVFIFYFLFYTQDIIGQDFKYIKIDNNIYKNENNELFLKIILNNKKDFYYISVVYSDDFESPDGFKALAEVIDIKTFNKIKKKSNYYKDKNHTYYLKIMYQTATLAIVPPLPSPR
jgi:hypothetical protein